MFTCLEAGLYYFTFFVGERGSETPKGLYAYLKINSVNYIDAVVDAYHNTQDLQGGNAVVVRLDAGDSVWVSGGNAQHVEGSVTVRVSSFTGIFLYP